MSTLLETLSQIVESDDSISTFGRDATPGASSIAQPPAPRLSTDAESFDATPKSKLATEAARRQAIAVNHEEETLWRGGYSPKAMVGSWVLMTLATAGSLITAAILAREHLLTTLAVVAVAWVWVLLRYYARRMGVTYELTNQRFIHRAGVVTHRTDRIEVIDIDDVSYSQGPVQRMFGIGSIEIISSDRSDPMLHLLGINEVGKVAGMIDDVRRAERRRRALHIESI